VATNGSEAVEAVKRKQYDLVLMDCQMPEMDGFTAAGEIRRWEAEQKPSRRIPIVALTANALKGDRGRCIAAGMDDYLSKPIAADNLRDTLIRFIGTDPSRAVEEASAE
jgi:CheY-like chemotaxis protein